MKAIYERPLSRADLVALLGHFAGSPYRDRLEQIAAHDKEQREIISAQAREIARLAAGPEAKACVPEIAPNPAKGGPPLSIARVLQLAVAALHDEQHHSLAEEVRSVAVALAAPPAGAEVREAAERVRSLPPSTNEFNVAVANLLAALRGGQKGER